MQNIPPIGDADHLTIISHVNDLVYECDQQRGPWLTLADRNMSIFTYGTTDNTFPEDDSLTIPEIQTDIIAATDVQMREPPNVTVEAVTTGDPGKVYWTGPSEIGLNLGLIPESVEPVIDADTGIVYPPIPVTDLQQKTILGIPEFDQNWLLRVNDTLIADVMQTVFDVLWIRSGTERFIRNNLLQTNICGWNWSLYEFDKDNRKHVLRTLSVRQVYSDMIQEDVADSNYVIVDFVVDRDEAIVLFPQIKDMILQEARQGVVQRPVNSNNLGRNLDLIDYRRPVVLLRLAWIRNQPCPMTAEEALECGKLEEVEVPDPTLAPKNTMPIPAGEANPENPDPGIAAESSAAAASPVPTRKALCHPETGEEMTEDHHEWPQRTCVRQIIIVNNILVEDRPCPYGDIPVLHNVNIPVAGKPFGIGEPTRLWGLNRGYERMMDALATHFEYYKHPMMVMSQSAYDATATQMKSVHTRPDMILIVPDDVWQQSGGKPYLIQQPPPLPEGTFRLADKFKNEINELSGNVNAQRGIPSTADESGVAAQFRQMASSSLMSFKAKRTEDMVQRLGELMLHSILNFMTVEEIGLVVKKYPMYLLDLILKQAKSMDWEIKVTVTGGSAGVRAQKKREAIAAYQAGLQSQETTQEVLNIDPQQERERQAKEVSQAMQPPPGAPAPMAGLTAPGVMPQPMAGV